VAAGTCFAASPPARVKVVTDGNYPPYLFQGEDGQLRGLIKDKWDLWSRRTGVPVDLQGMTWRHAQEVARKGEADVIEAIAPTEERRSVYEFSAPYATIDARVFFHQSVSAINDIASMHPFTVGAKEGSACGRWLAERGIQLRPFPTSEALVSAAAAGNVRLFCMDSPTARYLLVRFGLADQFRESPPLYSTSLHWAVPAGKAELRDFIQAGFAGIPADELEAIDARWMGNPVTMPIDRRHLAYILLGAAFVVVGAALLLLWNRSLRVRVASRTTDLRNAMEIIAKHAEDARDLYDNAPCGYHSLDLDGRYVDVNDTELRWLGETRESLVGRKRFSDFLTEASREQFRATFPRFVETGEVRDLEYDLVRKDGTTMRVLLSATMRRDAGGRPMKTNTTLYDITARTLAEERAEHLAHHDALTGLPNRTLLRDRLQQAISQAHRGEKRVGVVCADLDRFKAINDSFGQAVGDRLLQAVAQRLLGAVRDGDTLSRVGGDGFVAVLPELDNASIASAVAMQILACLADSFDLDGQEVHVGASVGVSLYPDDGSNAETLLRHAETAMLHAKEAGRANYQFFAQHMNVAAHQRLAVETALRRGLENDEFELQYQPICDLRTRSPVELEALLRWRPQGRDGPVSPIEFIGVAEDSRLIVPIGDWVLREALAHAREWQRARPGLKIAVNVSANQLARPDFFERLRAVVEETQVDPRLIEMEVTESVIIESRGAARETIDRVAALGTGIVIDDFGTGYAGLAYLKRLPVTKLKIDQSFVRNLPADRGDAAIVAAILAMARGLGVQVVAEGVETEEQLAELRRLGCELGQGFLLSRPLTADRADALLAARPVAAVAD
jgi:diguanylate cyclase (GGDEF)-like protein/PAS domain S-box-containing protein